MGNTKPDPTPDQIVERCLEIQATWTPEQERNRRFAVIEGRKRRSNAAVDRDYRIPLIQLLPCDDEYTAT